MEKQLKCVLLLSLKEISLRRVAVLLWSSPDILASISEFSNTSSFKMIKEWRRTHDDKIKDKILKLDLPVLLTNQVIDLVGPMSLEVRAWKDSQQGFIWAQANKSSVPDSAKLCWTTAGTINDRKTAEELLRCDKLDVEQRYKIACYCCLEDRISFYWEELSEEKKDTYCSKKIFSDEDPHPDLPYCWPYILKGEDSHLNHLVSQWLNLTSFNQFAFESSAKKGNETAAKYFFQKLSYEEREASLMRTANTVICFDILKDKYLPNHLVYLLSLMTPEQQIEIIKAHPVDIFLCFLRSQLQGLFRENAGLLWALFPPDYFYYTGLLKRIFLGYPSMIFPKMINEFFMESPQDCKTTFAKYIYIEFLDVFFRCKDPESIKVVFRNVDAATRVKLVQENFRLLCDYMLGDKRHLVELCLREATLSKEEKGRLKKDFTRFFKRRGELENPDFKKIFEFLDETDASSDKQEKGLKRKARKRVYGTMILREL